MSLWPHRGVVWSDYPDGGHIICFFLRRVYGVSKPTKVPPFSNIVFAATIVLKVRLMLWRPRCCGCFVQLADLSVGHICTNNKSAYSPCDCEGIKDNHTMIELSPELTKLSHT